MTKKCKIFLTLQIYCYYPDGYLLFTSYISFRSCVHLNNLPSKNKLHLVCRINVSFLYNFFQPKRLLSLKPHCGTFHTVTSRSQLSYEPGLRSLLIVKIYFWGVFLLLFTRWNATLRSMALKSYRWVSGCEKPGPLLLRVIQKLPKMASENHRLRIAVDTVLAFPPWSWAPEVYWLLWKVFAVCERRHHAKWLFFFFWALSHVVALFPHKKKKNIPGVSGYSIQFGCYFYCLSTSFCTSLLQ